MIGRKQEHGKKYNGYRNNQNYHGSFQTNKL